MASVAQFLRVGVLSSALLVASAQLTSTQVFRTSIVFQQQGSNDTTVNVEVPAGVSTLFAAARIASNQNMSAETVPDIMSYLDGQLRLLTAPAPLANILVTLPGAAVNMTRFANESNAEAARRFVSDFGLNVDPDVDLLLRKLIQALGAVTNTAADANIVTNGPTVAVLRMRTGLAPNDFVRIHVIGDESAEEAVLGFLFRTGYWSTLSQREIAALLQSAASQLNSNPSRQELSTEAANARPAPAQLELRVRVSDTEEHLATFTTLAAEYPVAVESATAAIRGMNSTSVAARDTLARAMYQAANKAARTPEVISLPWGIELGVNIGQEAFALEAPQGSEVKSVAIAFCNDKWKEVEPALRAVYSASDATPALCAQQVHGSIQSYILGLA